MFALYYILYIRAVQRYSDFNSDLPVDIWSEFTMSAGSQKGARAWRRPGPADSGFGHPVTGSARSHYTFTGRSLPKISNMQVDAASSRAMVMRMSRGEPRSLLPGIRNFQPIRLTFTSG